MRFGAAGNLLYSRGSQSVGHDLSVGHQNPGVVSDHDKYCLHDKVHYQKSLSNHISL